MKKFITVLLMISTCLSLSACGDNKSANTGNSAETTAVAKSSVEPETTVVTEPPIETVSFDDLIADLENEAKAQLNVGKGVNIFGQVTAIKSDSCTVQLFHDNFYIATVKLPTEVLAEMRTNQIIVVSAIVESVKGSHYVFTADSLADLSLLETYINDKIASIDKSKTGSSLYSSIQNLFGMSLLYDYLSQSGSGYCSLSDAELKDYLQGQWFYNYAAEWDLEDESYEFKSDGTYIWKYNYQKGSGNWVGREQDGEWSVSGINLDVSHNSVSFDKRAFILSENAFIWSDTLYTRVVH